ncbi:MAG: DUF72 domain-containing protein, partial [Vulcanisaeta sp.]
GRTDWYWYDYSEEELRDLVGKALSLNPVDIYVFFNNDHWMLDNARRMLRLLNDAVNKLH